MAAIDIGTDNLNDFDPETRQFIDPDSVKTLSHAAAKDLFDLCRELKLRPYIGVFEPGHLRHVGTYLDKGWIEPPVILRFFFSDFAPFGLPPHPECVGMYAEMIEMVMPGRSGRMVRGLRRSFDLGFGAGRHRRRRPCPRRHRPVPSHELARPQWGETDQCGAGRQGGTPGAKHGTRTGLTRRSPSDTWARPYLTRWRRFDRCPKNSESFGPRSS